MVQISNFSLTSDRNLGKTLLLNLLCPSCTLTIAMNPIADAIYYACIFSNVYTVILLLYYHIIV